MGVATGDLETFLHSDHGVPALVECALVHAQFETIHPFLDGNGRVGRLLITFLLVHRGLLQRPLLYLSYFLKRHRTAYYARLTAIREDGDWEGWLRFFLVGVQVTAEEAVGTARAIIDMRERHQAVAADEAGVNGVRALESLFQRPLINVNLLTREIGVTFATANRVVDVLRGCNVVEEVTGGRRNRVYRYTPYLELFDEPNPEVDAAYAGQVIQADR